MAAKRTFYFPGSGSTVYSAIGNIRVDIWYTDTGLGSPVNTDIPIPFIPGDLDLSFEISANDNTFRHASLKLTFANISYDATNNYFEQYSILSDTYKKETFVRVWIGGSEYWNGIIDWDSIERSSWYLDGSTLKYRKVSFTVLDILAYFWINPDKTLALVSSVDNPMTTILQDIINLIDFDDADLITDTNFKITEVHDSLVLDMDDFKIWSLSSSTAIYSFLKDLILDCGFFMYNLLGKVYLILRAGGTTVSIDTTDIGDVRKMENDNKIKYINIHKTVNYNDYYYDDSYTTPPALSHAKTYGDSLVEAGKKFERDLGTFHKIYTTHSTLGNIPSVGYNDIDSGSTVHIYDADENFITDDIESGMMVTFDTASAYGTSIINKDVTTHQLNFPSVGVTPLSMYKIFRNSGDPDDGWSLRLLKIIFLIELIGDTYNQYFLTSPDVLRVRLKDAKKYDDFEKRYVFTSLNWKIKKANIRFDEDEIVLDLVRVT